MSWWERPEGSGKRLAGDKDLKVAVTRVVVSSCGNE